jgi:uncharacterized OB-fold protein
LSEGLPGRRPLPEPDDALVGAFWEHCSRGELRFQRCDDCGTWRHLPRVLCARCRSAKWSWERSSGRGTIFSWTVTHQRLVRDFPDPVPYAVVVVELEEGVRMVSGIRDVEPASLTLDLPVEVVFETVDEGVKLPFFRPRAA